MLSSRFKEIIKFRSGYAYSPALLCMISCLFVTTLPTHGPLDHFAGRSVEQNERSLYQDATRNVLRQSKRSAVLDESQTEDSLVYWLFEHGGENHTLALATDNVSPNMTLRTLSPSSFEVDDVTVAEFTAQLQDTNRTRMLDYLGLLPKIASAEMNKTLAERGLEESGAPTFDSEGALSAPASHSCIAR